MEKNKILNMTIKQTKFAQELYDDITECDNDLGQLEQLSSTLESMAKLNVRLLTLLISKGILTEENAIDLVSILSFEEW